MRYKNSKYIGVISNWLRKKKVLSEMNVLFRCFSLNKMYVCMIKRLDLHTEKKEFVKLSAFVLGHKLVGKND